MSIEAPEGLETKPKTELPEGYTPSLPEQPKIPVERKSWQQFFGNTVESFFDTADNISYIPETIFRLVTGTVLDAYNRIEYEGEARKILSLYKTEQSKYFEKNPKATVKDWKDSDEYKATKYRVDGELRDIMPEADPVLVQLLSDVFDSYRGRYGSLDKAGNTMYQDPIGVAMDFLPLVATKLRILGRVRNSERLMKYANRIDAAADPLLFGMQRSVQLPDAYARSRLAGVDELDANSQRIVDLADELGIPREELALTLGSNSKFAHMAESKLNPDSKRANRIITRGEKLDDTIASKQMFYGKVKDRIDDVSHDLLENIIDDVEYFNTSIDNFIANPSQNIVSKYDKTGAGKAAMGHLSSHPDFIKTLLDPEGSGLNLTTGKSTYNANLMSTYVDLLTDIFTEDLKTIFPGSGYTTINGQRVTILDFARKKADEYLKNRYTYEIIDLGPEKGPQAFKKMQNLDENNRLIQNQYFALLPDFFDAVKNLDRLEEIIELKVDISDSVKRSLKEEGEKKALDRITDLIPTATAGAIGLGTQGLEAGMVAAGLVYVGKTVGTPALINILEGDAGRRWLLGMPDKNRLWAGIKGAEKWANDNNVSLTIRFGLRKRDDED